MVGTALLLAGCGGSGNPIAKAGSHDPAVAALADVADTSAARKLIVINDLGAVWHTAGLPTVPTQKQALSRAGLAAAANVLGGSAIGYLQWEEPFVSPLGYNPFRLQHELVAGEPGSQVAEVWGPIRPAAVQDALVRLHPTKSTVQGLTVLSITPQEHLSDGSLSELLLPIRHLALPAAGNRMASGTYDVPTADVTGLVAGKSVSHPLASDPDVKQLMALWGSPTPITIVMGTGLVAPADAVAGASAPPATIKRLETALGLDHLPAAPVFAGLADTGGPSQSARWIAAAIYPNAGDAQAAATILGHDLRAGTSPTLDQPFSKLWTVSSVTAKGNEVVARFTQKKGGYVLQSIEADDFPLFWSPAH
jgi:hypothetical protein